jgi:hypothetical protein
MRSGIICIMLVTGLILASMPHADKALAEASGVSEGLDLIVVCGGADDNAIGEIGAALVIRSFWLNALFEFGVTALETALKVAVGVLLGVLT